MAEQTISIVLSLLRERMRIKVGFSLQRSTLEKIGKMPLEVFDSGQTHNWIHPVADGQGDIGISFDGRCLRHH